MKRPTPGHTSFWGRLLTIGKVLVLPLVTAACGSDNQRLPILGQRLGTTTRQENGQTVTDTLYQTIPAFRFVNQQGDTVSNHTFDGHIYVADFFFTTCPTICPRMTGQMKRLYDRFSDEPRLLLLSHSIDPDRDSVARLRQYAFDLGIRDASRWHFVTGPRKQIFDIGQQAYLVTARTDSTAPGGLLHSGAFVLVDEHKRLRGIYDGTSPEAVSKLMEDITLLLKEIQASSTQ